VEVLGQHGPLSATMVEAALACFSSAPTTGRGLPPHFIFWNGSICPPCGISHTSFALPSSFFLNTGASKPCSPPYPIFLPQRSGTRSFFFSGDPNLAQLLLISGQRSFFMITGSFFSYGSFPQCSDGFFRSPPSHYGTGYLRELDSWWG